jgi:hypothetical protein
MPNRDAIARSRQEGLKLARITAPALPDIPELARVPRRLLEEDEQEIRFALQHHGAAMILESKGAFGGQLERAECYGFGALPCRRCGGTWRRRQRAGKGTVVDWVDGTGMAPRDHFGKRVRYAVALASYRKRMQKQHGIVLSSHPKPSPESGLDAQAMWDQIVSAFAAQGKRVMTDAQFRAVFAKLPEEECQPCKLCSGIGVVPRRSVAQVEITVFPTGSSKGGKGSRENDDADDIQRKLAEGMRATVDGSVGVHFVELARHQSVMRLLRDAAALSTPAALAIEEYYVAPGGGFQRLEELCAVIGFEQTRRMAEELYGHACAVYNLVAYGAV